MAFVGDGEWSVTAASGGFTPTGRLAEDKGCDLADLSLAEMQSVEAGITEDIFSVLTVDASVASRTSYGGTAPVRVREQIAMWEDRLGGQ